MQTIARDNPFADTFTTTGAGSTGTVWTGRILSGLAVIFLGFDAVAKLLRVQPVIDATVGLGYPTDLIVTLGMILLSCVIVYVIPRTALLGAVLLTGYLGGAVATQLRVGNALVSNVLFPTYVAALAWGGLVLRDARLRAFLRGALVMPHERTSASRRTPERIDASQGWTRTRRKQ